MPDRLFIGAWARPLAARKLHFFADFRVDALCGAYMARVVMPSDFARGTIADERASAQRCPQCERKLGYLLKEAEGYA